MYKTTLTRFLMIIATAAFMAMITISASAQTEKILYSFTNGNDGGYPQVGLVSDGKGNLFGTTESGGANSAGVAFELSPTSSGAWTEQILYNFSFSNGDAAGPYGGVVFDNKGNLYGASAFGGTGGLGTVYELSPGSNGAWSEQILYSFNITGGGGDVPFSGVILDSAGNIYGFASGGAYGSGVVYELVPGSNGTWTQKVLHSFANENDGAYIYGSTLIFDGVGNLYGVAAGGPHDYGIVFELVHGSNGGWTEKILYASTGAGDGGNPYAGLVFDNAGNLYGVAGYSVFELMPGSNGSWTQRILYTFKGGADGAAPSDTLTFDTAGNLYGTTSTGGAHRGTVFELTSGSNGTWTEKVLHRYASDGVDGVSPGLARLALDAKGNLYGTTFAGGTSNSGVVYEVTP